MLRIEKPDRADRLTESWASAIPGWVKALQVAVDMADDIYNEAIEKRKIMEENNRRTFVTQEIVDGEEEILKEIAKKYFSPIESELEKAAKESDLEALAETDMLQKIIDSVNSSNTVDETSFKSNVVKLSEDVLSRKVGIITKVVGDLENPHSRNVTFRASVTFDFLRCLHNRTFCLSERDAFVMARRNASVFAICQTEHGSSEYVVVPLDDFDSALFDVDVHAVK